MLFAGSTLAEKEERMCACLFAKIRGIRSTVSFTVLLIAAVGIISAGCSREGEQAAATDLVPLAARLDQLDGEVGIAHQNDTQDDRQDQFNTDWQKAAINTPVSAG